MGKPFISEQTTHIHRGKGTVRCDRCGFHIRVGQQYRRWVERYGNNPLIVGSEHDFPEDCPGEVIEIEAQAAYEACLIPVEIVISSQLVAKVTISGETIYSQEPCTEMRIGNQIEEPSSDEDSRGSNQLNYDSDDEIPF